MLEKIHVNVDGFVFGIIICGKIVESDDPLVLNYTTPHEIMILF